VRPLRAGHTPAIGPTLRVSSNGDAGGVVAPCTAVLTGAVASRGPDEITAICASATVRRLNPLQIDTLIGCAFEASRA
jgi:hypothetical protein